jgi:hypothetical protein
MSRSSILEVSNQRTPFTHGKQDLGHCAGANGKKSNQMQISTRLQTRLQWCRSPLQGEVSGMCIRSVVWCWLSRYLRPCCETLFDPISSCHNCTEEFRHDSIRHQDSVPVWRSPRTNLHDPVLSRQRSCMEISKNKSTWSSMRAILSLAKRIMHVDC